nr:hypothetical protein [Tanacetum cinerariifolium]
MSPGILLFHTYQEFQRKRRELLVKFLEDHCKTQNEMVGNDEKSAFEFVYLPIEFKCQHMLPGPTAVTVEVRIAPFHTMYPAVAWVALLTEEITDMKGPVPIQFELLDKQTVMPLGDHAAHWSSYIGEVIRGVPLYYPSWLKVSKEQKAMLITDIEAAHGIPRLDIDKRRHPAALAKAYNTNKAAFKAQHWVIDPTIRTYNVEKIRREHPKNIMAS